jgi:hypothetical protein
VAERGQAKAVDVMQSQVLLCDIDKGDIAAKLDAASTVLGPPTMTVASGGVTEDGQDKMHAYWRLTEPAEGAHLELLAKLRYELAVKIGGDWHFGSMHQPIRMAGTVYLKHGRKRLVRITARHEGDYELADLEERIHGLPALTEHGGEPFDFNTAGKQGGKKSFLERFISPVFEGGDGDDTRFAAISGIIGHHIRAWHQKAQPLEAAWEAVKQYNAAMVRPPWPEDRLRREFEALKAKHTEKHGEPDPEPEKNAIDLLWFADIQPALSAADFVENVLCDGQMSVIYGESNCGKTFFMTDMALHIALGRAWHGRETIQGGVIYLALEGAHGIRNRIAAFRQKHGLDDQVVPFAAAIRDINLWNSDADSDLLIEAIEEASAVIQGPVKLVIVDTLSRALAGGNENSSEDMGKLVRHADRIRKRTAAHIAFIHHSGKDSAKGARGHSLLRAATDTEIEIQKHANLSTATITKQRELETNGSFAFTLDPITIGTNSRGKPITSCIVNPSDEKPEEQISPQLQKALIALANRINRDGRKTPATDEYPQHRQYITFDEWLDECASTGVFENNKDPRKALQIMRTKLTSAGKIGWREEMIWLV